MPSMVMVTYAPVNLAPRLSQVTPQKPSPSDGLPAAAVNAGVVALGIVIASLGYYNRKTDMGAIALGAGSSIVGAGVVILALELAGFRQIQF